MTANMTLDQFLDTVEALAALADGHITIFRFTTHWKIQLGTPDLVVQIPEPCSKPYELRWS